MKNKITNSYLAGILIGIACGVYCSVDNKYMGAFLFALGLCAILRLGFILYTGRIHLLFIQNSIGGPLQYLIVFLFNALGVATISALCNVTGINPASVAEYKLSLSISHVFCASIICGILMTLAVVLYNKDTNPVLTIMCIATFILVGGEHCVANVFYIFNDLICLNPIAYVFIVVNVFGNTIGSIIFYYLLSKKEEL